MALTYYIRSWDPRSTYPTNPQEGDICYTITLDQTWAPVGGVKKDNIVKEEIYQNGAWVEQGGGGGGTPEYFNFTFTGTIDNTVSEDNGADLNLIYPVKSPGQDIMALGVISGRYYPGDELAPMVGTVLNVDGATQYFVSMECNAENAFEINSYSNCSAMSMGGHVYVEITGDNATLSYTVKAAT